MPPPVGKPKNVSESAVLCVIQRDSQGSSRMVHHDQSFWITVVQGGAQCRIVRISIASTKKYRGLAAPAIGAGDWTLNQVCYARLTRDHPTCQWHLIDSHPV